MKQHRIKCLHEEGINCDLVDQILNIYLQNFDLFDICS